MIKLAKFMFLILEKLSDNIYPYLISLNLYFYLIMIMLKNEHLIIERGN